MLRGLIGFGFAVALMPLTAEGFDRVSVPVQDIGGDIILPGRFDKPAGEGPFPAVIILHGCNGYSAQLPRSSYWADQLRSQGYASLIVDSFNPRGKEADCVSLSIPFASRALDTFAAAAFLAARPDIRRDKIAAIGFSHGGHAVVDAAIMAGWRGGAPSTSFAQSLDERRGAGYRPLLVDRFRVIDGKLAALGGKFAAFVAFYTGTCTLAAPERLVAPLLILVGDADAIVPAAPCQSLAAAPPNPELRIKVYPGATHEFDYPLGYYALNPTANAPAAADAGIEVRNFLARYLK